MSSVRTKAHFELAPSPNWSHLLVLVLMVLTLWASLLRFPRVTPDSKQYLVLVEIFKGHLPVHMAVPPYCYRVLMPFIVSLFPTDPLHTWAALSVLMNLFFVLVVYYLVKSFDIGSFGAFAATGLTTVGVMSIKWGSWVGNDLPAMLFLGLVFLAIKREMSESIVLVLLVIGTLFKEFVIIGAGVWFFWSLSKRNTRESFFSVLSGVVSALAYMSIRQLWGAFGISANWFWRFNDFWNFTHNFDTVVETFFLGFMFFIPAIIIALLWGERHKTRPALIWMAASSVLSVYMFLGLFMAYFDLRFVWPLYLGMAPMAGIAGEVLALRIRGVMIE